MELTMIIFTNTYIPYEYDRTGLLKVVMDKSLGIKRSIRLVEKDTEHLTIRCPVTGEYLDILGTADDIEWLFSQMTNRMLLRLD